MKNFTNTSLSINNRISISQSMQYSIKILEMTNLELLEHAEEVAESNPFLIYKQPNMLFSPNYDINNIAQKLTQKDELLAQATFLKLNDIEKCIAEYFIDHAISQEYISTEIITNIANFTNIDYKTILNTITKLKNNTQAEFFSFNIKDKLQSIMKEKKLLTIKHMQIINNIDLLFANDHTTLKNKHNITTEEIFNTLSILKKLNFSTTIDDNQIEYHIHDISIEENIPYHLSTLLNEDTLPVLKIDKNLLNLTKSNAKSTQDKNFIAQNYNSASLLIKSVKHRNHTLVKIVKEIANRQLDFFIASKPLQPISQQTLANALFVHESTISRAISHKKIMTPLGIFSIKQLLPKPIQTSETLTFASDHSIKEYIKTLISNEPKHNPYSDEQIASVLSSRGVKISRRTVAKYRNTINIPNSSQRTKIHKTYSKLHSLT